MSGLTNELIFMGIGLMLDYDVADAAGPGTIHYNPDELRASFPRFLEASLDKVSYKIKESPGSRVFGNDRRSYSDTYASLFGTELPDGITYPALFEDATRKIASLVRDGALDPEESLTAVGERHLGYSDLNFIQPSVIKQMEFYERTTDFLKPTTGGKSMIELDPIWFALLSLGFLWGYSGYYGGFYYVLTSPQLEAELHDHSDILATVESVSEVNIRSRKRLDREEVYELGLSLELAKRLESVKAQEKYRWPLRLYKERVVGQAFTAEKSMDVDLHDLVEFSVRYVEAWRNMDPKPTVKVGEEEVSPLEALIRVAERELSSNKGVKGDNEMAALLLVKDIHRAISSGRTDLVEEALFRVTRKARGIQGGDDVDRQLRYVLYAFCTSRHLEMMLEAVK